MDSRFEYSQIVTSDKNGGSIEFRLRKFQRWRHEDLFQSEIFVIGKFKWRVVFCRTFPLEGGREKLFMQLLYCNARLITFDISISFRNQLRPDQNLAQIYGFCRTFPFCSVFFDDVDYPDYEAIIRPTSGFLVDNTLVVTILLSNIKTVSARGRFPTIGNDMGLISVEILSEDSIRKNMREGCSFGLTSVKRRRHHIVKRNSIVSTFKMPNNRLWLCERTARGVILLQKLDKLPIYTKFGDLRTDMFSEQPWLTLYRERRPPDEPFPDISEDDATVFCKLYDPEASALTLADLAEVPVGTGFDVYIEEGNLSVRHLPNLYASILLTGVVSGSVVVVRLRLDGQDVSEETVRDELTAKYAEGLEVSEEEEEQEMATEDPRVRESQVDENDVCVVCMDAPRISGFLHGTTSHRCVCEHCALKILQQAHPRCPICRAAIQHTIFKMF